MLGWDPKLVVAIAATGISFFSLLYAWRSWQLTYRPIVTAFIQENGEGRAFDLKVSNSGNRPALDVELYASREAIDSLVEVSASPQHRNAVQECFSPDSSIAVIRNGETLSTALGSYDEGQPWLNYGAQADITIEYYDLRGKRYRHRMPLKVFVREGFGGSVWRRST
jgi:hypothetical protein